MGKWGRGGGGDRGERTEEVSGEKARVLGGEGREGGGGGGVSWRGRGAMGGRRGVEKEAGSTRRKAVEILSTREASKIGR